MILKAVKANRNSVRSGTRGHGGHQAVLLDRGILVGRDEVDALQSDTHSLLTQLIEGEPFCVSPKRNSLFQASAFFGSSYCGASKRNSAGRERAVERLSSVHARASYQTSCRMSRGQPLSYPSGNRIHRPAFPRL